MKKSLYVKISIVVVVIVLLVVAFVFGRPLYEQSKMAPLATGQVVPKVYAVNNKFVNFYLVKATDGYIMVDAGNDKDQTIAALKELEIMPQEITTILLTHSDGDHVATLSLFEKAQLYLPEAEIQMIDGTTKRNRVNRNQLSQKYQSLKDNEDLEIGGYLIKCLTTPGHTSGSMSYLFDQDYLFVGDTMSLNDTKAAIFNSYFNMDDQLQRTSIKKLATLQTAHIFTGHYGYSDNPEAAFKEWL